MKRPAPPGPGTWTQRRSVAFFDATAMRSSMDFPRGPAADSVASLSPASSDAIAASSSDGAASFPPFPFFLSLSTLSPNQSPISLHMFPPAPTPAAAPLPPAAARSA